jgi:hypothetical protein
VRRFNILIAGILFLATCAIGARPAQAASVTATRTNPAACDQTVSVAANVSAQRVGQECIVTFTNTTETIWTIPAGVTQVSAIIVGGGGGGGDSYAGETGGGGGPGGYFQNSTISISGTVPINVGAGGAGGGSSNTGTKTISNTTIKNNLFGFDEGSSSTHNGPILISNSLISGNNQNLGLYTGKVKIVAPQGK